MFTSLLFSASSVAGSIWLAPLASSCLKVLGQNLKRNFPCKLLFGNHVSSQFITISLVDLLLFATVISLAFLWQSMKLNLPTWSRFSCTCPITSDSAFGILRPIGHLAKRKPVFHQVQTKPSLFQGAYFCNYVPFSIISLSPRAYPIPHQPRSSTRGTSCTDSECYLTLNVV
jgi:hypothetical protein